jgi:hypothetical protein
VIFYYGFLFFRIFFEDFFFGGASPGSAGQIPNAGHPISAIIKKGILLAPKPITLWSAQYTTSVLT